MNVKQHQNEEATNQLAASITAKEIPASSRLPIDNKCDEFMAKSIGQIDLFNICSRIHAANDAEMGMSLN
jgi:hypothetical protein